MEIIKELYILISQSDIEYLIRLCTTFSVLLLFFVFTMDVFSATFSSCENVKKSKKTVSSNRKGREFKQNKKGRVRRVA